MMLPSKPLDPNGWTTELTTRSDFIELVVCDFAQWLRKARPWRALFVQRAHIISVGNAIVRHEPQDDIWVIEYGSASNSVEVVHPDSVEDLLKFIKEG